MKTTLLVIAVVAYLLVGYVWSLIARSRISRVMPLLFASINHKVVLLLTVAEVLLWPFSMPAFFVISRRLR